MTIQPRDPEQLRLQILQALEQTPDGQDLAALHSLLNRSRRDTSMLPVMGSLVSGGFLEKVSPAISEFPNAPISQIRNRRPSHPLPVRFRLTAAGYQLLQEARALAPASQLLTDPELAHGDADGFEAGEEFDRE